MEDNKFVLIDVDLEGKQNILELLGILNSSRIVTDRVSLGLLKDFRITGDYELLDILLDNNDYFPSFIVIDISRQDMQTFKVRDEINKCFKECKEHDILFLTFKYIVDIKNSNRITDLKSYLDNLRAINDGCQFNIQTCINNINGKIVKLTNNDLIEVLYDKKNVLSLEEYEELQSES